MPRTSLSHLYFESVSLSKVPLKWLVCASFIHAGLFCIPAKPYRPRQQGIVFREGNAGVEVDLIAESSDAGLEVTTAPPDNSPEPPLSEPDPEPLIAEAEFPVPAQPATTPSLASARTKTNKTSGRAPANAARAGTAIAQPAAQIYTTQPPYPPRAREAGAEGVVRLQVRIGIDGRARDVRVVRPSGRSDFDISSVNTVQHDWRFSPAKTADGAAIESTIVVAIRFNLKS